MATIMRFLISILLLLALPVYGQLNPTAFSKGVINTNASGLNWRSAIGAGPINSVNVLDYGAVGDGSTDDTAAFQSALASGIPVFVPPWKTNGYVISNIILSNNTLYSHGAKLKFKAGVTNFMIQFAPGAIFPAYVGISNSWNNNKLIGLELDGGGTTTPTSLGTRHGVWVDAYGTNNVMRDCIVRGFNGYGVLATSSKPTAGVDPFLRTDMGTASISDCQAYRNYYGFAIVSGTIFNADIYLAEYLNIRGLKANTNAVGIWVGAGNLSIFNSEFSRNVTGVVLYTTQNDGHGVMSGCLMNHNVNAIMATNISNGFTFSGCNLFQGDSYWKNCFGVVFEGGQAAGCNFTFDGGGLNYVRNNRNLSLMSPPGFTHLNSSKSITYGNDNIQGSGTIDPISYKLIPSAVSTLRVTNATIDTLVAPPSSFNGRTLLGQGWATVIYSANVGTNLTSQFSNVTMVNTAATNEATYMILVDEQSTGNGTAGTMTTTFNYTDQFGSAKTVGGMTLALGTAGGAHTNQVYYLKSKRGTSVGITTVITGGGGGSTYALDLEVLQIR